MDCGQINDCAIRLLSEDDKWLSFKNHYRKERMSFVVYADLECGEDGNGGNVQVLVLLRPENSTISSFQGRLIG